MELHEAIVGRRTIHSYKQGKIPRETLRQALQDALMVPNHKLTWPFRFYLPGPQTRTRLCEAALAIQPQPLTEYRRNVVEGLLLDTAATVFVSQVLHADPVRAREDYATTACAIYVVQLALFGQGIGSKWSTGKIFRNPANYEILGIDPEREQLEALIFIGHPEMWPVKIPERPPLAQVLHELP